MLFAVVLAALTALPACLSQGCVPPNLYAMALMLDDDVNGDGILTLQEMVDTFYHYDVDRDGQVSRKEYTDHQISVDPSYENLAHALYDLFDYNHDHHLTMDDYVEFYRAMDGHGDNSVTESEFVFYWTWVICHVGHHHPVFCMTGCTN